MPKMKTHRGAAKRFEVTPKGKIKRRHAFKNHLLEDKSSKRKRHLDQQAFVAKPDEKRVRRLLGG